MSKRAESGLTLIELLVGLSLLALLVGVLGGGLRVGLIQSAKIEERTNRFDEVRAAQRFLRQSLERARPALWADRRHSRAVFEGKRSVLDFAATLPGWPGKRGFFTVRVANDGSRLSITRRFFNGTLKEFDFSEPDGHDVLVDGMAGLRFSYFGKKDPRGNAGWHDEWTRQPGLPQLIRISAGSKTGASRDWPDLVVPLMIEPQPR